MFIADSTDCSERLGIGKSLAGFEGVWEGMDVGAMRGVGREGRRSGLFLAVCSWW